ncbi:MAG: pyridoxamine 5'-phosphate oxidase family protein [Bacillota bacterium]|nr:pyridoxamine 5'-phosphate oxidase family protein [Bacillota bacterium]
MSTKSHLRQPNRELTDAAEIAAILKEGKHAVLAMCNDNEPYIVTLTYGYDSTKNALYFHCGATGHKIQFIKANPRVCATVFQDKGFTPGSCTYTYKSVVMRGSIAIVECPEEKRHAIETLIDQIWTRATPEDRERATSEKSIAGTTVLRLDIEDIVGKKGP